MVDHKMDSIEAPYFDRNNEYDGVRGELPDWIPRNFHMEFHAIRSHLQSHEPDEIHTYVNQVLQWWHGELSPEQMRLPSDIDRDILTLASFWTAVQLGEDAGLQFLTDRNHAQLVQLGKKFTGGRKTETIGAVRKFIRTALKKNSALTNSELWQAIRSHPPKGWLPMENPRLGKYIEGPTPTKGVKWGRFCNIASDERKLLNPSRISEGVKRT